MNADIVMDEYHALQRRRRAQAEAWGEKPPVPRWRPGQPLPAGCEQVDEEFTAPCAVDGLRALFGRGEWSDVVEFRRYVSPEGIRICHGDQYDGFGARPYIAVLPDETALHARPRTTRRGTFYMRQLRWFASPHAALKAARVSLGTPPTTERT